MGREHARSDVLYTLTQLGWCPFFEEQIRHDNDNDNDNDDADLGVAEVGDMGGRLRRGRITAEYGQDYGVLTTDGPLRAILRGSERHKADSPLDLPAVGDWVMVEALDGVNLIVRQLERQSALVRQAAGSRTRPQVIGANLDVVFVVASINGDLKVRRLERYLTAVWEAGASPVIVLSKADLVDDADAVCAEVGEALFGVPVAAVTAERPGGYAPLFEHLAEGRTAALVGSSGVGKSTIVNHLLGQEVQVVREIRADQWRGKHTTTHRELFVLGESRGLLLDTPGMREFAMWDGQEGVGQTFEDIERLVTACAFRDCQHETEPGCAVVAAIDGGELDAGRWASYLKLQREIAHQERKRSQGAKMEEKRRNKKLSRMVRDAQKNKWG